MTPSLEKLLVLQDRDSRLRRVKQELGALPIEEKAIADRLTSQSKNYEALKLKAKQVESNRKDLDNQVLSKRDAINRYRTQQLQTKKNEEYQALGHEIERAEKEIVSLEDQEIELMEAYEAAQKEVAAEGLNVKEFEKTATSRREDLKSKQGILEKQKAELEAEVASLEKDIPPAELSLYRRILQSKGDTAMALIQHGNTCGGCHMKLTHQTILKAKGAAGLVSCDNCGRIVFWQSDFA